MTMSYPEIQRYSEIKPILKREAEDEKNWRGARARLPEIVDFLEAKEGELTRREQTVAAAESKHADILGKLRQAETRLQALTAEADTLTPDLATARQAGTLTGLVSEKQARLVALDTAIAERQKQLDTLTRDLNDLKARHSLT